MVDYPSNPPAGQSGTRTFGTFLRNAVDPFSDPTTTRLAQNNYAAGLQAAAAQGGGSSSATAATAAPAASAASAGPSLATTQNAPPPRMDLGYRAPDTKAAAGAPADTARAVFTGAVPFQALPSTWQSKLHETFGPEAPTRYESFRAQASASLAGGAGKDRLAPRTPQEQMEADFGEVAAGRGRETRDYRALPDLRTPGPFDRDMPPPALNETTMARNIPPSVVPPGGPARSTGPAVWPPDQPAPAPSATEFRPHVPGRFEGAPFQTSPTGGGLTPQELTATDAFGQAQAEGAGVVGGPAGGPPAPAAPPVAGVPAPGVPDPRINMGRLAEQPPGPGSTITVKPGDNLWTIARTYLGDPTKAKDIAQLNGIRHPSMIHPGMVLRLSGGLDPANVATPNLRPGAPTAGPAPPPGMPPPSPADLSGGAGGDLGQMGQGEPDELDDLTHAAATRAHEILGQASLNDYDQDEYPFRSGGGDVGTSPPARPSPTTSPAGEPLTHTGGPGTGRYGTPPAAVIREPGYQRSEELRRQLEQRIQDQRASGKLSALSDNDNGLPGVPSYVPGSRLPAPYEPNRMPDQLRKGIIPLTKPANTNTLRSDAGSNTLRGGPLKDILEADYHEHLGPPPGYMAKWEAEERARTLLRPDTIPPAMAKQARSEALIKTGRPPYAVDFTPTVWDVPLRNTTARSKGSVLDAGGRIKPQPSFTPLAGNRFSENVKDIRATEGKNLGEGWDEKNFVKDFWGQPQGDFFRDQWNNRMFQAQAAYYDRFDPSGPLPEGWNDRRREGGPGPWPSMSLSNFGFDMRGY